MKALLLALPLALLSTAALADTIEILYPAETCATIHGSDFSAPGADSSRYIFELLCEDTEGNFVQLLTNWATGSSFIGFSRAGMPDRITLTPADVDTLVVRR